MPVVNRIAAMHDEIAAWRRDLHAHPELQFDLPRTAGFVAEKLRAFGCDAVVESVGVSGVVGVIQGRKPGSGRAIGLRADMDALPIEERTGLPHASRHPGRMHACGHDGHTAMLLGAARYLAETRNFAGAAVVIFQPAEEGGGGGREMVRDGLMERFGVAEVYGMHNMPGLPLGRFAIRPGPFMAAADLFDIHVEGRGGHAAKPHDCVDATLVAAQIIVAAQALVARGVDPIASAVLSITSMRTGGDAYNVIAQAAHLKGTARTLSPAVRDDLEARLGALVEHVARGFGATAQLDYRRNYPVTVNAEAQTAFAADIAAQVAGEAGVDRAAPPMMGAEDFSFMLEARPGAMIFLGNGDSAGVHHPAYDFDDAAIPLGCSYWARLVETALPLGA